MLIHTFREALSFLRQLHAQHPGRLVVMRPNDSIAHSQRWFVYIAD